MFTTDFLQKAKKLFVEKKYKDCMKNKLFLICALFLSAQHAGAMQYKKPWCQWINKYVVMPVQKHPYATAVAATMSVVSLYSLYRLYNKEKIFGSAYCASTTNQDRYKITVDKNGQVILVVCDGHGESGGMAAAKAVVYFAEEFAAAQGDFTVTYDALQKKYFNEDSESGTTITACIINSHYATLANLGDSRALVVKKDGAYVETPDHSVINKEEFERILSLIKKSSMPLKPSMSFDSTKNTSMFPVCSIYWSSISESYKIEIKVDNKRIEKEIDLQTYTYEDLCAFFKEHGYTSDYFDVCRLSERLAVSRALGDNKIEGISRVPTVLQVPRNDIDFIIIASDGLWKKVSNAEAIKLVKEGMTKNKNLRELAQMLADLAFKHRGCGDDTTVIIMRV